MVNLLPSYFHLHLISDSTGETLTTIAKAAAVQYAQVRPIEHVHPMIRSMKQLARVLKEIEQAPGIVLYTVVNKELTDAIEIECRRLKVPALHVLQPIMKVFEAYLGAPQTPIVAGQHVLDADYFKRVDALNFTMAHDDGRLPDDLNQADIIILGISRTSKTPTSIYLAQRGFKTVNVPLVPGIAPPVELSHPHSAFVVGLIASPERIMEIRRNRMQMMSDRVIEGYADRQQIVTEIQESRRLFARHGWPVIDVTRRSISAHALVRCATARSVTSSNVRTAPSSLTAPSCPRPSSRMSRVANVRSSPFTSITTSVCGFFFTASFCASNGANSGTASTRR